MVLVAELRKLPGVGPRSAERIALHLAQDSTGISPRLAQALVAARDAVRPCPICGGLTDQTECSICADLRRDNSILCLVERAVDVINIEKTGAFRGKYHVLGGRLSPVNGIGPDDLRIAELERRLEGLTGVELIVALGSDVEGDATSHYIAKRLAPKGVKVSRLAHGLPVGGSLEYADELTLSRAIEGRRNMI
jgi:recombination protein RecR